MHSQTIFFGTTYTTRFLQKMTTREAKKITFMYLFTEVMETETSDVLFKVFTANDVTMIHLLAKLHILKAWNAYLLEINT